jgi:hypothetical protein
MGLPINRSAAGIFLVLALFASCLLQAGDIDEFKVKRQEAFEFAEKPTVTRDTSGESDRFAIRFTSKAYCDVTLAIEAADGRIIRHLASGVLGPNAPKPLQKGSLRQSVVWDGKDDQGRYIDDKSKPAVRVSLGLKPRFERVLSWAPKMRAAFRVPRQGDGASEASPIPVAAPEGVYVFDGGCDIDHLRLFDHDGGYLRTVYPFPADKLDAVRGLQRVEFPQTGRRLPFKNFFYGTTLLTSGVHRWEGRYGLHPSVRDAGTSAMAVAVRPSARAGQPSWIGLACVSVNRLAGDGSSGGLRLPGPRVALTGRIQRGKAVVAPRSAALSPPATPGEPPRWLYVTGYVWNRGRSSIDHEWLHAVLRAPFAGEGQPTVFAGSIKPGESGAGSRRFHVPAAVACDRDGRVYVADYMYMNDRIQVLRPDGSYERTIKVAKPGHVEVHPRTGDIYVFSWFLMNPAIHGQAVKPRLIHLGPANDPRVKATYDLPLQGYSERAHLDWTGLQYRFAVDFWTDPVTIWLCPGGQDYRAQFDRIGLRLLRPKNDRLVEVRDFGRDVQRTVARSKPASEYRRRLFVNPCQPDLLYVGEGDAAVRKAFTKLIEIDVTSGRERLVDLPFSAEDMCFDLKGRAYLRTDNEIVRFDPATWREIPWDYGEERSAVGYGSDGKRARVASALALPAATTYWHFGGLAVSPRGHLAVACYAEPKFSLRRGEAEQKLKTAAGRAWRPRQYPGRPGGATIHVFDEHGQLLYGDAVTSVGIVDGLGIDRDDRLYVALGATRMLDGSPYFNYMTGTLVKLRPGATRVTTAGRARVPLARKPDAPAQLADGGMGPAWIDGADWFYGGIGFTGTDGKHVGGGCACWNYRWAFDCFARSFVPEIQHCSVAVLDANGNLILRLGRYSNEDSRGPDSAVPLGGDEVGLFYPAYLATHTDRRLFIADPGNARIVSVRLDYHRTERVKLGR